MTSWATFGVLSTWWRLGYAPPGDLLTTAGWVPAISYLPRWLRHKLRRTWLRRIYWLNLEEEHRWLVTMAIQYNLLGNEAWDGTNRELREYIRDRIQRIDF